MSIPVLSDKDKSIITQVAFKAAADLMPSDYVEGLSNGDPACRQVFSGLADFLVEELFRLHNQPVGPESATSAVAAAFPGTTAAQEPPAPTYAPVIPLPTAPAAPAAAPAPRPVPAITGASPKEALYQHLFAEAEAEGVDLRTGAGTSSWYNNMKDKRSPKAPDFKHKTLKKDPSDQYTVSLYADGQYVPAWVKQALA